MPKAEKQNVSENNRFESISDFKDCIRWGGEIEFVWKGKHYGVFSRLQKNADVTHTNLHFTNSD